jgi:hypothetical protein
MDPVRATEDNLQDAMTERKYATVIGDDQTKALHDKAVDQAAKAHMSAVSKVFPQGTVGTTNGKGYGR